ncbi:MAG: hypothetical protein Q4D04_12985 [Clostridia bacterium]|nr:hypothetical protein [Clostridia bacterium]
MFKSGIKIGFLPLYIKLYDDSNPRYRDPMVEHMNTMVSMLESCGLEVVLSDVCRVKPEFEKAAALFNESDVDAVVTMHLAYSPSLEAIDALETIKAPIIVLDTTPDYELLSQAGYYSGISHNHGIHGVQDMCNLLRQRGIKYEIRAGHALHSPVISEVAGLCRAAAAAKAYKNARVGAVGGEFAGMGDFFVTPEHYEKTIGAKVLYMDGDTVVKYVGAVTDERINDEIEWDKANFTYEIEDEDAYRAAVKSGLAVRDWANDEKLTACTVNFLSLDICGLPKMPFAECSKMMMRGMGYAGEGDVLTAGLVGALRKVYTNTTFTEMFCPDWKEDVILLNHMGECNLKLSKWRPVLKTVPFNYNSCGDTAAAYGCMRGGKAVFVNLAPMAGKYTFIVTPVEMLDCGLEFGAYRSAIQGWLKPVKPLREFLPEFSRAGGTHHSALVYDADYKELAAFGGMMGFDVVTID